MKAYHFNTALPVWEKGKDKTMHYALVFRCVVPRNENTVVALTASSLYQMFVNGDFVAEGPARAGHGFYRVDEINISDRLTEPENVLTIYVAGYYVENFYLIKQPSFLCAEVLCGGKVVAATGKEGFAARYYREKIRKTARFSYQRTFAESYRLDTSYRDFDRLPDAAFDAVELVTVEDKNFLERGVPYPSYKPVPAKELISRGTVRFEQEPIRPNRTRYVDLTKDCAGFPIDETEMINTDEIEKGVYSNTSRQKEPAEDRTVNAHEYAVYTLGGNHTGFLRLDVEVSEDTQLMAVFDELDVDGDVSTYRMRETQNSVIWNLKAGSYTLVSYEPYVMQYIKLINKSSGALTVKNLGLIRFVFDYDPIPLASGDEALDKIYLAAVESFKQNVLDIYMDCASRERAGWLCDSSFTARVERELTGKSLVEKNFLENFMMSTCGSIDPAMIPMCYPSDFLSGEFIPNYAMWYVWQLEEYYDRTGDTELLVLAEPRIKALLEYFEKFENADGLLERLESWVFIEWSKANDFVQDVNYPSNMLYARMLRSVGRLYKKENLYAKAGQIENTVREQSYFDGFFHDHALRGADGTLKVMPEDISETCQYYAFYTGCAAKESYPELWERLVSDFGPERAQSGKWGGVYPSNAFMGNYMRLELLCRDGHYDKVLQEIKGFFLHMAEQTGTLWEHQNPTNSCNHGFASHVIIWLHRILNKHR